MKIKKKQQLILMIINNLQPLTSNLKTRLKAIIFDMDGVIIDSEPLWRKAEIEIFKKHGILLTDQECRETAGLRIDAVVQKHLPEKDEEIQQEIILEIVTEMCRLIRLEGKANIGFPELIQTIQSYGLKIGLATSSPKIIMETVCEVISGCESIFIRESAENLEFGKPHPQVYLNTLQKLDCLPNEALAIEDSLNGIIAAKAARLFTIAMPEPENFEDLRFAVADMKVRTLTEINARLSEILKRI